MEAVAPVVLVEVVNIAVHLPQAPFIVGLMEQDMFGLTIGMVLLILLFGLILFIIHQAQETKVLLNQEVVQPMTTLMNHGCMP